MIGCDDWPSPELHLKSHRHTKSHDVRTMPLGPQTLEQCIIPVVIPLDILASLLEVDALLLRCITFQLAGHVNAQARRWIRENSGPKSSVVPKRFLLSLVDDLARFNRSHSQEELEPPPHLLCPILAHQERTAVTSGNSGTTLSASAFSLGSGLKMLTEHKDSIYQEELKTTPVGVWPHHELCWKGFMLLCQVLQG